MAKRTTFLRLGEGPVGGVTKGSPVERGSDGGTAGGTTSAPEELGGNEEGGAPTGSVKGVLGGSDEASIGGAISLVCGTGGGFITPPVLGLARSILRRYYQ